MKKIIYTLFALSMILIFGSCAKNEQATFTGEFIQLPANFNGIYPRVNDGVSTPSEFIVRLAGPQKSTPVNFTFEVSSESTAIENVHYVIESNTGSIPPNSNVGDIPISILDDNIAPEERLIIEVVLKDADVPLNPNYINGQYSIQITCDGQDLSGSYSFVNEDNFAGETFTGEGEIFIFNNTIGSYKVTDFSFGSWPGAYGIDPPTGTLLFKENCGTISLSGTDRYGDVWTMTEIIESNGPTFKFIYENTYPEFGTVTLTRTDGENWPPLNL